MKPRLKIKGKKSGIIGSAISNFWSYVIFVFVVIIFFVFFQIQEGKIKENSIVSLEQGLNKDMYAINYLRTPIDIEIDEGQVLIAQNNTLADSLVKIILKGVDPQEEIDELVQANFPGVFEVKGGTAIDNRLMVYAYDVCLYDSHNQCGPIELESGRTQGIAIFPFSVGAGGNEYLKLVFQPAMARDIDWVEVCER